MMVKRNFKSSKQKQRVSDELMPFSTIPPNRVEEEIVLAKLDGCKPVKLLLKLLPANPTEKVFL